MKTRNLFDSLPGNLANEVFEEIAHSSTVRIERIVSKSHVSPATGWYDQAEHEWVIVLKGQARLEFEDGGDPRTGWRGLCQHPGSQEVSPESLK